MPILLVTATYTSIDKVILELYGGPLRANENWFFNGTKLEVVSCYKYLGSMFTPKLVWSMCQKVLATQAKCGMNVFN